MVRNPYRKNKDAGFTLVEILVVIGIIGVLAGISTPIFLNAQAEGAKAVVKTDVASSVLTVETYIMEQGGYAQDLSNAELVRTGDNVLTVTGTAEAYKICGYSPAAKDFRWGYNSVTGLFGECVKPPASVDGVSVVAGIDTLTVSWNSVNGATSYNVFLNGTLVVNTASTSTVLTGLNADTVYNVGVQAINEGGTSGIVDKEETTLMLPPTAPAGITLASTPDSITVNWNAVLTATSYNVFINNVLDRTISGTQATFTNLTPATTYVIGLQAVNNGGTSAIVNNTKATGTLAPSAPTGLTATSTSNSITVSWNASTGATSYKVFKDGLYVVTLTSETTYTITGLTAGTSYQIGVQALNAGGASAMTIGTKATIVPVPTTPVITGSSASSTSISLTWASQSGVSSYNVYKNGVKVGTTTSTTYAYTGLTQNTFYTLEVSASNASGESAKASKTAVTTILITGVNSYRTSPTTFNAQVYLGTTSGSMQVWVYNQTTGTQAIVYINNGVVTGFGGNAGGYATIAGNTVTVVGGKATSVSNSVYTIVYNSAGQGAGFGSGIY